MSLHPGHWDHDVLVTMLQHKEGELILMTADLVNYNSCPVASLQSMKDLSELHNTAHNNSVASQHSMDYSICANLSLFVRHEEITLMFP